MKILSWQSAIMFLTNEWPFIAGSYHIKTESIGKLSNFNFQWTKTLYQNILSHIAFFLHFSITIDVIRNLE